MKRFTLLLPVLLLLVLTMGSCRRAAENAARKIRLEAVEKIEPKGLTGAEVTLRIANGTKHKLALTKAAFALHYKESKAVSIRLHESIEIGKLTTESIVTRWRLHIDDPLAVLLLGRDLRADDLSQIRISYAIEGRGGPASVNIARENVPLSDFLNIFGLTLQDVKQYLR